MTPAHGDESIQGKLAARLRALRMARGLSARTLSLQCGFSASFISQVESDGVSPSLASLERIATELGVTLSQLFSSLESPPHPIVRVGERATHESKWSRGIIEVLAPSAAGRKLSAMQVTFETDGASGARPAKTVSDTFAMVLNGSLELDLNDNTFTLVAGDSVYLQEGTPCLWRNNGVEHAVLLLVSVIGQSATLPGFSPEDHNRQSPS